MQWDAERHREAARLHSAKLTAAAQEIGELPAVVNPDRRQRAIDSFSFFCESYFPAAFVLPWSEYHYRAASKIEQAVSRGGLFAFAMPRGSGKTTICDWAVLWALLTGKSEFVAFIGATEKSAERRLEHLKTQLYCNDLLLEDFPCECWPVRKLERSPRRAEGQKYKGVQTQIQWKQKRLVLPWINEPHALGSGSCVDVFGLTGEIRGVNHMRPDGRVIRPTFAVCDDPQTRESAKSASQSETRERTMAADIAYLAGPGQPIAVVMPCTVIYEGDMADNLLDRNKHPEYQGERTAMVKSFPTAEKLWDEYAEILHSSLRADGDMSAATDFYREHQVEMDAGAEVTWPERFRPDELSAIQHAMNLKIRDEAAFWSECQNQPMVERADLDVLEKDAIAAKVSGYKRLEIPQACQTLTAMVDVQGSILYYAIVAWQADFSGYLIDYGTWPKQPTRYFALRSIRKTLKQQHPGTDDEAAIFAGLQTLFASLLGRTYRRDDGAEMTIARCLVDANWGGTSALVNSACRQSPYMAQLTPSYGRGIKASHMPISQWQQSRGKNCGPEWVPTQAKARQLVGVIYDVNYWKKRWHDSLSLPLGSKGALAVYKESPQHHRMLADHLSAEVPKLTSSGNRTVYEWHLKPGVDNHLLDCCVGAMVGASICGVSNVRAIPRAAVHRKKVKMLT